MGVPSGTTHNVTDPASSDKGDDYIEPIGLGCEPFVRCLGSRSPIPNCIGGPFCAFSCLLLGSIFELRTERFTQATLAPAAGEY